jgi:hypothetical protein
VLDTRPGLNDVGRFAPGVYFISDRGTRKEEPGTQKIINQTEEDI